MLQLEIGETLKIIHKFFVTSIWLFRLLLKRKVFLLWPIERCKRGLSVRKSPELSSMGLLGLSWLVTVSPGGTVDDHVASTVSFTDSTLRSIYSCSSFRVYTVRDCFRSAQEVFYTRVLCSMEHGTTSSINISSYFKIINTGCQLGYCWNYAAAIWNTSA